eukprot:TRINITY_DN3015_c4_g1_i1.p1 TRINITY_DN3015_c4_g1~~TRINITY_DN3015_c4_g1_i1.p1  ORF type:complete len:229 (+),score=62.16 TRINITY_DN3015_c4_g1_i1:60-746(+)
MALRSVFLLLAATACLGADKVKVDFYGEALCPFCKQAMAGPVNQTITATGVLEIMDFEYIPWGNAYFTTSECGGRKGDYDPTVRECWDKNCGANPKSDCFTGTLVCQHGDGECYGNKVETCAKHFAGNQTMGYMPFTYCFEVVNGGDKDSVMKCAAATGADGTKITDCATSDTSTKLNQVDAIKTAMIPGGHPGVPYIIVNGTPLSNVNDLLKTVCSEYKGTKPAGCV